MPQDILFFHLESRQKNYNYLKLLTTYLSIYLSIHPSIYLYIYLMIIYIWIYIFKKTKNYLWL